MKPVLKIFQLLRSGNQQIPFGHAAWPWFSRVVVDWSLVCGGSATSAFVSWEFKLVEAGTEK